VPLKRIASTNPDDPVDFVDVLRAQRHALEAKRRHLAAAVQAIREAEATMQSGGGVEPTMFTAIIGASDLQRDYEACLKELVDLVRERLPQLVSMSQQEVLDVPHRFVQWFREAQAVLDEAPSSPRAQKRMIRQIFRAFRRVVSTTVALAPRPTRTALVQP
jgi:hypothetical protein